MAKPAPAKPALTKPGFTPALPQPTDSVALRQQLNRLEELQARQSPWAQYEFKTVTFSNANTDVDITHSLKPPSPEEVFWQVVSIDKDTAIYKDSSASRRAWDAGVIRLRAGTSSTTATLLLLVQRQ